MVVGDPVTSKVTGRPDSRIRRTRDGTSSHDGDLSVVVGASGSRRTSTRPRVSARADRAASATCARARRACAGLLSSASPATSAWRTATTRLCETPSWTSRASSNRWSVASARAASADALANVSRIRASRRKAAPSAKIHSAFRLHTKALIHSREGSNAPMMTTDMAMRRRQVGGGAGGVASRGEDDDHQRQLEPEGLVHPPEQVRGEQDRAHGKDSEHRAATAYEKGAAAGQDLQGQQPPRALDPGVGDGQPGAEPLGRHGVPHLEHRERGHESRHQPATPRPRQGPSGHVVEATPGLARRGILRRTTRCRHQEDAHRHPDA